MAEKVKVLNLERDHKKNLYYISGEGHVCAKPKNGGDSVVLHANAVAREKNWLYYLDRDGDVARSPMAKKKANESPSI